MYRGSASNDMEVKACDYKPEAIILVDVLCTGWISR